MSEDLRWKKFPVLDDGFVTLVDWMGSDEAVVQAARVSYGKGTKTVRTDEGLIRYLMRQRHSSPFEQCEVKLLVRVPMDTWRQWIRHRTACLSGDTVLHFDLPGGVTRRGNQLYKLTIEEVYNRFQPTTNTQRPDKQGNPYYRRGRVRGMLLRCLDEKTGQVSHTSIVDVWKSGIKPVYRVELTTGASVKMSEDHLCLTNRGWLKLKDFRQFETARIATITPGKGTGVIPSPNSIDPETEKWEPILGWEASYEISSQGRVRRIAGGRGSRSRGRFKKITVSGGRAITSLNRPGKQQNILVHREMLRSFVGEPREGQEACHNDGNSLNNVIENLRWDTPSGNANDRMRDGATTALRLTWGRIVSIQYTGEEMTYDLEVAHPNHNFSAGGMVVHNSVNEYSTRYSEAIDSFQKTDTWRLQNPDNKQGSKGELTPSRGRHLKRMEELAHRHAYATYKECLDFGVTREQARKNLPLCTYTEAYWKIDLHNLFHFLSLRMDSHAQQEIREYAEVIGEFIVAKLFPISWQAFVDYRLEAISLTGPEVCVLQEAIDRASKYYWFHTHLKQILGNIVTNKREREEALAKFERLGFVRWPGVD